MFRKYLTLIISAMLLALVVSSVTLFKDEVLAQMNDWKLLPQPERFTELYFEHHLSLPKDLKPGQIRTISFTVHNLEHQDMTYDYTLEAVATTSAKMLDEGSFTLEHDEYKTISEPFSFATISARTKVSATLENNNQSIHFWIDPAR